MGACALGGVGRILTEDPDSIRFLDDQESNMIAARNAGWNAETYRWGDALSAVLAKYEVQ